VNDFVATVSSKGAAVQRTFRSARTTIPARRRRNTRARTGSRCCPAWSSSSSTV